MGFTAIPRNVSVMCGPGDRAIQVFATATQNKKLLRREQKTAEYLCTDFIFSRDVLAKAIASKFAAKGSAGEATKHINLFIQIQVKIDTRL